MDWDALSFDWNHARAFMVTAELGSLSKAAEALGLSQPTLSRQVEAIQQAWGVVLFERAGRGLALTRAGAELLSEVRGMGTAAWHVKAAADRRTESMHGTVVIAASDVYATSLLPLVVPEISRLFPELALEIVVENGRTDLRRREADIAIRSYDTEHSDLIAVRMGWDVGGLYASHDWVERHGAPETIGDLERLPLVGYPGQSWLLKGLIELGFPLSEANLRIVSESHLTQWAHVRAGAGVGVMTLRVGDADPSVRRLLADMQPLRFPVWLVTHRDLRTSRRVRTVFDMVQAALSPLLERHWSSGDPVFADPD